MVVVIYPDSLQTNSAHKVKYAILLSIVYFFAREEYRSKYITGSRVRLVESTLFGDHVSLRLHREFSLKFNLSN